VGALVLGTAFPHLLNSIGQNFPWRNVIIGTTILATLGGLMMYVFVPDGPNRKAGSSIDLAAFFNVFKNRPFRFAAFGYFGHMWELYAFWAFVPVMLNIYSESHYNTQMDIPMLSFLIIGIGGLACVGGGYLSQIIGSKRVAFISLFSSGICCMFSPWIFSISSHTLFIVFLLFWGVMVIADSPMFSTLVAQNAPANIKGTALTIVNCIGFAITIISIQLLSLLYERIGSNIVFIVLAFGPLFGLISISKIIEE